MAQTLLTAEGVLLVEGRVLRRVIKVHRHVRGLSLGVPHAHCYALQREDLLRLLGPDDLEPAVRAHLDRATHLPSVILVARLSQAEEARLPAEKAANRVWRAAFHAKVHVEIERRIDEGALTEATLRERIDRIGQTEFDDVREILRQDDLLLPPGGDREAYTELCALFLELRYFAPRLLATTFPSLDIAAIEAEIARDLDARALLDRACPEGLDPGATIALATRSDTGGTTTGVPIPSTAIYVAPEGAAADRVLVRAAHARASGNLVRAALLGSAVALGRDPARVTAARAQRRKDLEALGARLDVALAPASGGDHGSGLGWTALLIGLAEEAAARGGGLRYPIEARLLLDLQNAALAHEKPHHAIDLVTWARSLGKRPIVRPLPATRPLRVARALRAAANKVKRIRIAPAERKLLARLLDRAAQRADANVRAELRPRIINVLIGVGLRPTSIPEQVASNKLVEELLDQAVGAGFLNLSHARDALSRNHLKLDDVESPGELWRGDALLRADRTLAVSLDGVYRPGEIYLRGLQKLSSLLFGTSAGRAIVLYAILPLGGAFIVLEGASHLLAPVLRLFGMRHPTLFLGGPARTGLPEALYGLTTVSFWITAVLVFGLIHSDPFRAVFLKVMRGLGAALGTLFITVPRWILSLPSVEKVLEGRPARVVLRHALIPAGTALAVYFTMTWLAPRTDAVVLLAITLPVFAAVSAALATRVGDLTEDVIVEHVAPTWKAMSQRVLPGVLRAILDFFRWALDRLERVIYRVDEALRFEEGESRVSVGVKAGVGVIWYLVAYVIRVYVTLLIEPYVNPVKQVPMTAAAHKMMLPFAPGVLDTFTRAFRPLGGIVGGPLAAVTAFFFPTIFGFFGWELKENLKLYRASRKKELGEATIGAHGETMNGLLVPGFHAGTLPNLFARLRRAARREEEQEPSASSGLATTSRRTRDEGARGRFREGVAEVEAAIRRFVERELARLLVADPRWPHGLLVVERVTVGANRMRVLLACPMLREAAAASGSTAARAAPLGAHPLELTFEEQSGFVVAGVAHVGFADALTGPSRVLFENALAGLYKLAAVDLVREQLEAAMGADLPYDIAEPGLVVWPGPGYQVEALYPLRTDAHTIEPSIVGGVPERPLPPLDARAISFRHQPIAWSAWVYAWTPDAGRAVPRLMSGPSLIPAAAPPRPLAALSARSSS